MFGILAYACFGHAGAVGFECLIEPTQTVEIGSPVVGLLDRIYVRRGERVTKGQILATLESRAEQAATELARLKSLAVGPTRTAESKLEFSRRKFSRRKEMTGQQLMSAQDRDDAEAEYRLAEAELQTAKENKQIAGLEFQQQSSLLNLRTIRSPFDGVVVDQILYPGEVVDPVGKRAILRLAQLDPLRVHVILPMTEFGRISMGASAEVTPELPAGGKYVAKVKSVDKLIDAASGTFVAYLEMANSKLDVPAGVRCKASLSMEASRAKAGARGGAKP